MVDLEGEVDLALLPVAGWGRSLGPGHLDPARAARPAPARQTRATFSSLHKDEVDRVACDPNR
jgi:hypothetical protein